MVLALAPAPHHDILYFLVSVAILLVAARGLAEVAARLGQPPVVGEILAGVVLGPSVLSALFPALGSVVVPRTETAGHLLEVVGLIGAMFLLIITGIETDIPLIKRNLRTAAGVAAGGLVLPFAAGIAIAFFLPDNLLGDPSRRGVFALFLATAMAVSAIPVVAKVLLDLGLLRRTFGQTVLAAGMIDDTTAWVMLSIVIALAAGTDTTPLGIALASGRILLFLALSATAGRWVVDRVLALVQDRFRSPDIVFTLVVATAIGFGAVAQALEIEAVLGAFVAGIIFGQNPRLPSSVVRRLHTVTLGAFAPVFFAIAGLKVDVVSLAQPGLPGVAALILGTAIAGKVVGAYLGARLVGVDHYTSLAYGSALNARGAVEIIIASIGLSIGILTPELYSIIVLTAVATSVMTPSLVRYFLSKVPADPDEERRVARASADQDGMGIPRRILVPVRPRPGVAPVHRVAAELVSQVAESPQVTLLSVADRDHRAQAEEFLSVLTPLFHARPTGRVVVAEDPLRPILEAATGHDLIVMGAPESSSRTDVVFNPVVDDIARMAPCPTLIVTGRDLHRVRWPAGRILVPTNGRAAARKAAQLAFTLAGEAEVIILHVVPDTVHARVGAPEVARRRRMLEAEEIVGDLRKLAEAYGVKSRADVRVSTSAGDSILAAAGEYGTDLVVLGTELRPGSTRLHLGPQVEIVLQRAPCPVLVLNTQ